MASLNSCKGNKRRLKKEIPWNNTRLQAGLVSTHTISRKQVTAYSQQPCLLLLKKLEILPLHSRYIFSFVFFVVKNGDLCKF